MKFLRRLVFPILVLGGAGFLAWQLGFRPGQATAPPVASHVTQDPANYRIFAEGRVETYPGARITLSSEVAGQVTNVLVQETSRVQGGELLVEIQSDEVYAALMEARARRGEITTDMRLAVSEIRRGEALLAREVITPQQMERLRENLESLSARQTTAGATVLRLETTLAKTRIRSPFAGTILSRQIHPGEVIHGGTALLTVADLSRIRIEAEVDEYDVARVRVGAKVLIRAEGFPAAWPGRVEEIPDVVGSRSLMPRDPAQPSEVRVLLVKVAGLQTLPLKLGQRVEVEISGEPERTVVR